MKFIHSSDWHIGRQFHNSSLLEDQRHVLQQLIDIAITEQVDAILIAGDLYDRAIPSVDAIRLVDDVFYTLTQEHEIPVILIPGNHDSPERLAFAARQLGSSRLHILGLQPSGPGPVIIRDAHGEVAIYGIPYCNQVLLRDVFGVEVNNQDEVIGWLCTEVERHKYQLDYQRSIVLSHCFIGGSEICDSERPLSVGDSEQVSARHFTTFSYTALGHLHGAQYRGNPTIRYSGSPLKYSFSEVHHHKSFTMVDMDEKGSCTITEIPTRPLHEVRVIEGLLDELLAHGNTLPASEKEDYLLARLTDRTALLDPMHRLRQVYPNILAMERSGLLEPATIKTPDQYKTLQHSELTLFRDFYEQIQQDTLSTEQETLIIKMLHETASEIR